MKEFFSRLLFVLVLVFFEYSFFSVLFSWVVAPLVLLAGVVAWTLVIGFPRVLFSVVPLAILFDILSSGTLGTLTLYIVLLAYATSFLSRRLLAEHQSAGMFLYAAFSGGSVLALVFFDMIASQGEFFLHETVALFVATAFSLPCLFSIIVCALLFPIAYRVIGRFEKRMDIIIQGKFLRVR